MSSTNKDEQRKEIEQEVANRFPDVPAEVQSDLVEEILQIELDTEEVIKKALGIKNPDAERVEKSALDPWGESELDELCIIDESDIQAAAQSATPKLRELNTAPPAN